MLSNTISLQGSNLVLKAQDERFNCYKHVVTTRDPFVANFCDGNVIMLQKMLEENSCHITLSELEKEVVLELTSPVCLRFKLKKEEISGGEHSAMILGKLEHLIERIDILEERTADMEEQLEHGVVFPGLAMGVVPRDTTKLHMTFGMWGASDYDTGSFQINGEQTRSCLTNNTQFTGSSLKPLTYLSKLEDFRFGTYDQSLTSPCKPSQTPVNDTEFHYLGKCKALHTIWIIGTPIETIDWVENLPNLENVVLRHSTKAIDLTPLLKCTKLKQLDIKYCKCIANVPNFPSGVAISK